MINNRILFYILFSIIYGFAFADSPGVHSQASGQYTHEKSPVNYNNLPQADSGIQIVPLSQMPGLQNNNNRISTLNAQEQKHGYIKRKSDDAIQLLAIKKNKLYANTQNIFLSNNDPYDTHLKSSLSQIKLAFPFHGISFIEKSDVVGYAVAGTWKNGWTGVAECFTDKNAGICDYVKHNLKLAHGAVMLAKEYVTYDINSKPTLIFAEGQKGNGFSYKVEWYDDTFYHTLKCATENFEKNKMLKIISLAKRIDLDSQ
jgi:hypothetical protein